VQSTIRRPVARCLSELMPVIAAEEIPEFMNVLVVDAVRPPGGQPQGAEAESVAAAA